MWPGTATERGKALIMALWFVAILYVLLAAAASVLTWSEQRNRRSPVVLRFVGFVACAFWPVAVVAMVCAMAAQAVVRRRNAPSRASVA